MLEDGLGIDELSSLSVEQGLLVGRGGEEFLVDGVDLILQVGYLRLELAAGIGESNDGLGALDRGIRHDVCVGEDRRCLGVATLHAHRDHVGGILRHPGDLRRVADEAQVGPQLLVDDFALEDADLVGDGTIGIGGHIVATEHALARLAL